MKSAAKRKNEVGGQAHVYRNRTAACLVSCRCHGGGETPQCGPVGQPLVQSGRNRCGSIFPFCKSTRQREAFDHAVL